MRDNLSIKGAGIRFPGQQFHRIKAEPLPDALAALGWTGFDTDALRQTLQQVAPTLEQVQQARNSVRSTLQEAGQQLTASATPDVGQWAQGFAQDFARIGEQPPYALFTALAPAVQGISRQRVDALLTQESVEGSRQRP
ncbi:MAG: hypothetical protein KGL90_00975 [Burkholderiales bacterium]|nr:hypothetical protein [Burkholderiales bacterium]